MPRTLIVSNRLPTKVQRTDTGLTFQPSEGGLATGLGSIYRQDDNLWIGWPGLFVQDAAEEDHIRIELAADNMAPVFLTEDEIRDFYEGFSNSTLWPTFHYFSELAIYEQTQWEAYVTVNQKFCEAVLAQAGPEDTIWVHDYQLLLLPELLRRARPEASIGFFLHIPFPSQELIRVLPWRTELLRGMLGADLIGFHTFGYMRHFLSAVSHLLGYPAQNGQIETPNRSVRVDAFPMGIDYGRYAEAAASEATAAHIAEYRERCATRVILSIDRLDYTKGIAQRLKAFDLLLQRYPEWRGQVSLIMLVVPSRDQVAQYASLKEEIDNLVGRINAQYRTISWNPILYFYRSLPLEELTALYRLAEVALVTPMRDGMNLVAKEFVASKLDQRGVLILSERAGAARELSDAILINPTDVNQVVEAMHDALVMPEDEQTARMKGMQALVKRYNVFSWTKLFMNQLAYTKMKQHTLEAEQLTPAVTQQLLADFHAAEGERLILLDYDGTLVGFHPDPQRARPGDELRLLLRALAALPHTRVVIISGRDRDTLQNWLGDLPLDFIAEHGVWLRAAGEDWQLFQPLRNDWKRELRPVLELYVARTAGSFIEEKDYSLVWHYRRADADLGQERAREMLSHLLFMTANTDLQVLEGNKVVEIKNAGINKGTAAARWLAQYQPGFVLALGDDRTDEDTFRAVPDSAYTVRVGAGMRSLARFNLASPTEVRQLLRQLLA